MEIGEDVNWEKVQVPIRPEIADKFAHSDSSVPKSIQLPLLWCFSTFIYTCQRPSSLRE